VKPSSALALSVVRSRRCCRRRWARVAEPFECVQEVLFLGLQAYRADDVFVFNVFVFNVFVFNVFVFNVLVFVFVVRRSLFVFVLPTGSRLLVPSCQPHPYPMGGSPGSLIASCVRRRCRRRPSGCV
jgi:hypothetical protein